MATGIIPFKTPAGHDELAHRSRRLGQRYRTVLLLIDGRRSADQVLALSLAAGVGEQHYRELLEMGLVALPDGAATAPTLPAPFGDAPEFAPTDDAYVELPPIVVAPEPSSPSPATSVAPEPSSPSPAASDRPMSAMSHDAPRGGGGLPDGAAAVGAAAAAASAAAVVRASAAAVVGASEWIAEPVVKTMAADAPPERVEASTAIEAERRSEAGPARRSEPLVAATVEAGQAEPGTTPPARKPPTAVLAPVDAAIDQLLAATMPPVVDGPLEEAREILLRAVRTEAPVAGRLTLLKLKRAVDRSELEALLDEVEARIARPRKRDVAAQTLRHVRQLLCMPPSTAFTMY